MLDSTGFKRLRFDDLFAQMEDKAKETFGDTINTSIRSPMGIILRIFAWFLAIIWSTAEDVYNSGYIPTATGNNLDRLGPQVGITRTLAQWASGQITITGIPGYVVPAGFRASTASGVVFETLEAVTLTAGTGTVAIEALEAGAGGNWGTGMITVVVNPVPDIINVINAAPITGGREKETDAEFRNRFDQSVAGGGAASVDALRGGLLRLPTVRAAAVIENTTMTTDSVGRPAKSFQSYVLGGDEQEIADTIFATKSGGIESYGAISVQVEDLGGQPHTVKFSRAAEVAIKVSVTVTKNDQYPADGDEQVRSAIIRYIGGTDAVGSYYNGLSMGGSVVYTRLISAVYSVEGVEDVALTVGKVTGSLGSSNVVTQAYEVAQTTAAQTTVSSHV
ncbi:baseplate J/gp47 family protein [Paenibacillus sp. 19GGS1-52]|uniref:baseplate J/gp47 family protein n=1 Tax=Paenibacillus sp. 19GGS1-52 TaxID=2758563 RepID=UPI001EFA87B8|nr:baseplate J/gp47 family protein [Paenibacillus sp. 19GGS1-52]ULO08942.1 baseplate J/gp47 family protein [Paenibacillus sp. 19GGS1-52]